MGLTERDIYIYTSSVRSKVPLFNFILTFLLFLIHPRISMHYVSLNSISASPESSSPVLTASMYTLTAMMMIRRLF